MEKKSPIKDVYKKSKQDYSELYKNLSSKLGDRNPFAKFNIGAGMYVWSDSRYEWRHMTDASELEQSMVIDAWNQVKSDVAAKVGEKTAEVLFTVPDDSYIYFNDDEGDIKILVTGWGFKKPVRPVVDKDTDMLHKKNPVSVEFIYDGGRLADYEFGLRLARQVKRLKTDREGAHSFGNLKVGEHYVVTDFRSDKDFNLDVVEGKNIYRFDVTEYVRLDISASCDGQPIAEEVKVMYHGKEYDTVTDTAGHASLRLPLYEGESAVARMRDKQQSTVITKAGGLLSFAFETEKPAADLRVAVRMDGKGVASHALSMMYGGRTINGSTDSNGLFTTQVEEIPGEECVVDVPGYDPQSKILSANNVNEFVFDKSTPVVPRNPDITKKKDGPKKPDDPEKPKKPDDPVEPDVKVMFRDLNGKPIECDHVMFSQKGKPDLKVVLKNGDTTFPKSTFEADKPINVQINGWEGVEKYSPITFEMTKDENEYLLQEKEAENGTNWWSVVLGIIAVIVAAVLLTFLWGFFEGFSSEMFDRIYH